MRFELHNPPNRFSLSDILEIQYPPHCSTNLLCNLTCEYGYKLNGNRCPLCECNDKPIENCSFSCGYGLAYMPLNDRLCKCTKHCRFDCNHLFCPNGYEKGMDGCDICKCKGKHEEIENSFINVAICKIHCLEFPSQNTISCSDPDDKNQLVNGNQWYDGCRKCVCFNNRQYCSLISCNIKCTKPIYRSDSCCPVCSGEHLLIPCISSLTPISCIQENEPINILEATNVTTCYLKNDLGVTYNRCTDE